MCALGVNGVAQGVDVGGVSSEVLGAVVKDGDAGLAWCCFCGGAFEVSPERHVVGFVESVAGEEDGVRQETVEVFEVCCAAFCEVGVGSGDYACGDGGNVSEFGVNGEFAGYDDGGCAGGEDAAEPVFPSALAAEEADDDDVGGVDNLVEECVGDLGGVGVTEVHHVCGVGVFGGEEVGVGGGQQRNHGGCVPFRGVAPRECGMGGEGLAVQWRVRPELHRIPHPDRLKKCIAQAINGEGSGSSADG